MVDSSSSDIATDVIDNLELLENLILQYESALKRGEANTALIHLMFRAAHNSKGAFGILGLETAQGLVHNVEAVLDRTRTSGALLDEQFLDFTLQASSLLKDLLSGENRASEIIELTEKLSGQAEAPAHTAQASRSLARTLTPEQSEIYRASSLQGFSWWVIEKSVLTDIKKDEFESLPIYEDIKSVGVTLLTEPSFEAVDRSNEEQLLSIIFASGKPKDELECAIFDPFFPLDFKPTLSAAAPKPQVEKIPSAPKKPRILVVEDDLVSRKVLGRLLSEFGECDYACDGREGLISFLLSLEEQEPYTAICLDIMMPNIDGMGLLRQIRRAEEDRGLGLAESTKVIMTTCLGDPKSVLTSFKDGCEGYLTKPLDRSKLRTLMQKLGIQPLAD